MRITVSERAALGLGLLVSFVVAVDAVRWIRPALLTDADASWALARWLLALLVGVLSALAGGVAAGVYVLWSRSSSSAEPLRPLPLAASTRALLCAAAVLVGGALRFSAIDRIPEPMWVDDVSLIRPVLGLHGSLADFADAIRAAPFGVAKPYGTVGVLYLEIYRASLALWGATVFGVRFPAALAGTVALVTGTLLGRALLPAGGGTLTALILAGLRWQLILSRWAWIMIVLVPIVDLAALFLVVARKRRSRGLSLLAGLVAGIGAHVYLSAWTAGMALGLFALWPLDDGEREPRAIGRADRVRPRIAHAAFFVLGFALAAAPLFLLRQGRRVSYFARTSDHNVMLEIRRASSLMPPAAAAADALAAPWFLSDPSARDDLPGRHRLPWLLGAAVAIAVLRALRRPRDSVSAFILANALAGVLAVVAGGQADNPNGSRFAYLTTAAAVAGAAGVLWLVGLVASRRPAAARLAATVAVGVISVEGVIGARDALLRWPERRETFDAFHAQDTLIGRAASRWEPYGTVGIEPGIGHSPLAYGAVQAYALDPDAPSRMPGVERALSLRIVRPATSPDLAVRERVVEVVRDDWGREWARVLARPVSRVD